MRHENHRGAALLTVVLTVAFHGLGTAPRAYAQRRAQQTGPVREPQVRVFKEPAPIRGVDQGPPPPPPPPLTEIATQQILRNLSVSNLDLTHTFWLSPNQLYVPDKGKLWLVNPVYVTTGATQAENRASFPATQKLGAVSTDAPSIRGEMLLAIKAAANQMYVVDCSVGSKPSGGRQVADFNQQTGDFIYFILEINGKWKEKWPVNSAGGQHLVFALHSVNADWYQFGIYAEVPWIFYSCRVVPK